ncbi:DUF2252 domain-containing protein [Kitasatospora sp. YST-16]|uniref:DUF2252 domain-containing protein n=1 Tax=unclassified Kitasatospora TaxID=2633591 RepID=UPI0004C3AEA6|nr:MULTISPECIES: DUF2252 domain-containing protein [unclassified Kitasatospora]WAL74985.1 DUF2252 domain-containing protein [Kitasatospora sp. YST-16]WNW41042.1 DUF2252 domain-containing protein [Streptomyces sp. Li-HN-5-13]
MDTPAPYLTVAERTEVGRAARKRAPRSTAGHWRPAADRPDPLAVLRAQAESRLPDLVPIRNGRMAASPFAFLRGAAAVMAGDLATAPDSGLTVQLCGDAHLVNFGLFASPERALLFDLNDFDETLPGPFEWDVQRLAASLAVAAQENGESPESAHRVVLEAVRAYRERIRQLAGLGELPVWYRRIDADELLTSLKGKPRQRIAADLAAARRRDSLQAAGKLTETTASGRRRFKDQPPLIEHVGFDTDEVRSLLADYRATLPEERGRLLDRYRYVDTARKVVGVGSVGTRCFVVLLQGRDADDPLVLQVKEAQASVLEPYAGPSRYDHHGQRVVAGQRLTQAASDIFLGWMTGPAGRHFYWRQLRDMKGSAEVGEMTTRGLRAYAALCGAALARAHARSGDRIAIAAYLGRTDTFDRAVAAFAHHYAGLNTADHARLAAAIAAGEVQSEDA